MATSAPAENARLPATMAARAAGWGRGGSICAFMAPLDFDVGAQFHHAVRGDVEEVRGARRVASHPGEDMVAPQRHAGDLARRNHGLARKEERGVHHVEREPVAHTARVEDLVDVGLLLESVPCLELE